MTLYWLDLVREARAIADGQPIECSCELVDLLTRFIHTTHANKDHSPSPMRILCFQINVFSNAFPLGARRLMHLSGKVTLHHHHRRRHHHHHHHLPQGELMVWRP